METALGCSTTCGDTCRTHRSSGSPQKPRDLVPSKPAAFVFLWELLTWFVDAGRLARKINPDTKLGAHRSFLVRAL
jgi:hypothetical protein